MARDQRPSLEFFFDYGSPFSYLADTQLPGPRLDFGHKASIGMGVAPDACRPARRAFRWAQTGYGRLDGVIGRTEQPKGDEITR
jgi:hypothetical protein